MNRSFQRVLHSSINQSKSKQSHAFPKQTRFKRQKQPLCVRDSYDLSKLNMTANIPNKLTTTSLSPRFRYRPSNTPSPCDYQRKSFVEESRQTHRGPKILAHDRINQNRHSLSPGPGQYNPNIKSRTPQITMSPRYERDRKVKQKQVVSPAYYDTTKIEAIGAAKVKIYSKYKNVSFYKIGHEPRFKNKSRFDADYGPGSYNISTDFLNPRKVYSFGSQKRVPKHKGENSPGPGAYQQFSQFAQRRHNLQSKLFKLTEMMTKK